MASSKRPRSAFEADLQQPFVTYGTPLPPTDSHARDDGSYVPVWKQEVTDERGRKRLHGAFTGGFSAGYFNTVGSKEGWTPSNFVSSRTNRRKDEQKTQRPEDFMDEEDLQEQEEAQKLQTNDSFAGFGTTENDSLRRTNLMDLFKIEGETMGVELLRRMGWRDGQGIGPRVRRKARFDTEDGDNEVHLFAPDDPTLVSFIRKDDRKGLGFAGEIGLELSGRKELQEEEEEEEAGNAFSQMPTKLKSGKSSTKGKKGGFGMGVLNDTGSDDEDPYEMGPRISYNKVIGSDKKKGKTAKPKAKAPPANPLLTTKPVFTSKKTALPGFRKCHDGRLPLDGFLLSAQLDNTSDDSNLYPLPFVPVGWKSSKIAASTSNNTKTTYQSTADAAKASSLDPKSRAALLGEAPLPGKSVFDFLKPSARDRLASASGRSDLPMAKGESLPNKSGGGSTTASSTTSRPTSSQTQVDVDEVPTLDSAIATAALSRSATGWMPYADVPSKLSRYRKYLESQAGLRRMDVRPDPEMKHEDWIKELHEFSHAARVFRPVTGAMASRFQTSSSAPQTSTSEQESADGTRAPASNLWQPSANTKPIDEAEQAASMKLFGPLTRKVLTFYPTRLACKRFGVKPPSHVNSENEGRPAHGDGEGDGGGGRGEAVAVSEAMIVSGSADIESRNLGKTATAMSNFRAFKSGGIEIDGKMDVSSTTTHGSNQDGSANPARVNVDAERNEALEADRPGEALFRAIFGDDSDDE